MLPTQLIKKGCIVSFISLLLLTAVLYFVVYKTLVVESFGSLNQIGEALSSGMTSSDKAVYAHYFTKRTADQADDDTTPCGPDEDLGIGAASVTYTSQAADGSNPCNDRAEADCVKTVRIKQKWKAKDDGCFGDEGALYSDGRTNECPDGTIASETGGDYKTRYNVYPCKWSGSTCVQDSQACGVVSDSGYGERVDQGPPLDSSNPDWTPDATADVESQRLSFLDAHA